MSEVLLIDPIISQIRSGDDTAIVGLYRETRPKFLAWVKKQYHLSEEEGAELFQMSVVILYDQIATGKLKVLTSAISTYLFAIAKNKAYELLRQKGSHVDINEGIKTYLKDESEIQEKLVNEERLSAMERAMLHLGDKCRDMLRLFYYQKMSMDDIAKLLNYSSRGTAKNMKYKCLEQLRKKMQIRNI